MVLLATEVPLIPNLPVMLRHLWEPCALYRGEVKGRGMHSPPMEGEVWISRERPQRLQPPIPLRIAKIFIGDIHMSGADCLPNRRSKPPGIAILCDVAQPPIRRNLA